VLVGPQNGSDVPANLIRFVYCNVFSLSRRITRFETSPLNRNCTFLIKENYLSKTPPLILKDIIYNHGTTVQEMSE